jgi:hypothetical protein
VRVVPLLAMMGCTAEQPVVRLDLPLSEEHRAVVIALELGDRLLVSAHAIDAGTIAPVVEPFELDQPARATALLYRQDLEALALDGGVLEESAGGRAIPAADRTVGTEISDATASGWDDVQRSPVLDGFRFSGADPCVRLSLRTIAIPGTGLPTFALGFPEGVLFAREDGQLFFVDRNLSLTTLSTGRLFFSALNDGDRILLGSTASEIWSGELDPSIPSITLAQTATAPHFDDVLHLDGGGGDLFAQSRGWFVEHFDGTSWRTLSQITDQGRSTGIARIGSGRAFSAYGDSLSLFEHGERTTEVPLPANRITSNGISALIHDPSYGTIAGSFIGELLEQRTGSAWTKLEGAYATIEVTSIVRYGEGFFYSDERSVLVQWDPAAGFCPIHAPEDMVEGISKVARTGSDLVVIGRDVSWWSN